MLKDVIEGASEYFVRQQKEWTEILTDFETRNRYRVLDASQREVGSIHERSGGLGGLLKRNVFGSHRSLEVRVHDADGSPRLRLQRPFFFFFSSLEVLDAESRKLGEVHRRFGVIHKKYALHDAQGRCFAEIRSPFWRLWTFPVRHASGIGEAEIGKRWGGALREVFSDADTYRVAIGSGSWSAPERWVLFAAAISIDFDFFEDNQPNR